MAPRRRAVPQAVRDVLREWGQKGGKKGGKARWVGVSADERSALAKKAVAARWAKRKRGGTA
jgi:hypothetical protein